MEQTVGTPLLYTAYGVRRIEVQELEALSHIDISDELLVWVVVEVFLVHDEVVLGVQREVSGFEFGIAVEADEGTVAGVDVGIGTIEFDAMEGDVRICELEEECRLWAPTFCDGGG